MASTTGTHPYDFQRPSTMATRALISETKPSETPSLSSNDVKEVLQRETTDNYTRAAAEASKASNATGTGVVSGGTDRPGIGRQQSWKMSDKKREVAERMLAGEHPHQMGYDSVSR